MRGACQRGQSMIEFAMIAPICLALLVGGVDTGNYVLDHMVAAQAVRQGVRVAAQLGPGGCPQASCYPDPIDQQIADRVLAISGIECGRRYQIPPGWPQGGMRDFELISLTIEDASGQTNWASTLRPCSGGWSEGYPLNQRSNKPPVGRIAVTLRADYHPALSPQLSFPITERAVMDIQQDIG